jgi:hypothetical protein
LLRRAQEVGQAVPDLEITQLLTMVSALPDNFRAPDGSSSLLNVLLRGIRR